VRLSPSVEDRIRIATPEGVAIELTLAGLASRSMAGAIDLTIILGAWFLSFLVLSAALLGVSEFLATSLAITELLLLVLVVPAAFEVWRAGQTPGKSAVGLRTLTLTGQSVGWGAALTRNVFRLVDFLPLLYGVGLVAIGSTELNQRVGDVAAGTIVVRDKEVTGTLSYLNGVQLPMKTPWDVTQVSDEEITVIRRYFERRPDMSEGARQRLAAKLARHLQPKVLITDRPASDEEFLLRLLAEKLQRTARR